MGDGYWHQPVFVELGLGCVQVIEYRRQFLVDCGVGDNHKTTSYAHIARALAREYDCETLVVDLAGQQNDLAMQFGLLDEIQATDEPAPTRSNNNPAGAALDR